jgi:uncharacterized phiE125 gp8 family phage protein
MDFQLVEGPESEPITVAEARMHLRVDDTEEDAYIGTLVGAARRWIERTHGLSLVSQTFDGSVDAFPWDGVIKIDKYPLRSVTSITYHDEDLTTSTVLSASSYQVDTAKRPPLIALKSGSSWPTASLRATSGVVVRFVAGYGTAEDVPEDIRHALKLLVAQMYNFREPEVVGTVVARVQYAVDSLLADHRLY